MLKDKCEIERKFQYTLHVLIRSLIPFQPKIESRPLSINCLVNLYPPEEKLFVTKILKLSTNHLDSKNL